MRRVHLRYLVLFVLLVALGGLSYDLVSSQSSNNQALPDVSGSSVLKVGEMVPTGFVLERLGGGAPIDLRALLAGRPAVINLFASWCQACVSELSAFGSVARHAGNVVFVGIDTNDPDSQKALRLLHEAHASYPVALDTPKLGVASAFGIANLPTTLYVGRDGRLLAASLGAQSTTELKARARELS